MCLYTHIHSKNGVDLKIQVPALISFVSASRYFSLGLGPLGTGTITMTSSRKPDKLQGQRSLVVRHWAGVPETRVRIPGLVKIYRVADD